MDIFVKVWDPLVRVLHGSLTSVVLANFVNEGGDAESDTEEMPSCALQTGASGKAIYEMIARSRPLPFVSESFHALACRQA